MRDPLDIIKHLGLPWPVKQGVGGLGLGCCCVGGGPSSCEDTSRPICHVDKYATGAGDGSSWADAYTTIQAAVTAHGATHRIGVIGYGSSDAYSENVICGSDANITGISDCWIDGYLSGTSDCCIYNITATGSTLSNDAKFYFPSLTNQIVLCVATTIETTNYNTRGFYGAKCTNCTASSITASPTLTPANIEGFADCECNNCVSSDFSSSATGIQGAVSRGFYNCTCIECIAGDLTATAMTATYGAASIGFQNSDCEDCVVGNLTAYASSAELSDMRGFLNCTSTTGCTCTPEPEDGCIVND